MGAEDRSKRRDGENHMGCRRISHSSILQANPLDRYGLPQGLVDFKQYRGENTGPGSDFKPPRHLRQKLLNRDFFLDSDDGFGGAGHARFGQIGGSFAVSHDRHYFRVGRAFGLIDKRVYGVASLVVQAFTHFRRQVDRKPVPRQLRVLKLFETLIVSRFEFRNGVAASQILLFDLPTKNRLAIVIVEPFDQSLARSLASVIALARTDGCLLDLVDEGDAARAEAARRLGLVAVRRLERPRDQAALERIDLLAERDGAYRSSRPWSGE